MQQHGTRAEKPLTFTNHRGEAVSIESLKGKHKPVPKASPVLLKRTTDRANAKVSDGFIVTGYSVDYIAKGKEAHEKKAADVAEHNRKEQQKAAPKFLKAPDLWTEERFMLKNKPQRVRHKPYELESAADQCADLARKAGWKQVIVQELMKG